MAKKVLKVVLGIILAIVVIVVAYLIYVFAAYYRLDDNLEYEVEGNAAVDQISTGEQHRISSANVGFGAYSDDFTFFMDGGTESWAFSKEAVNENITGDVTAVAGLDADIMMFQEIDTDSTRSYHVDEEELAMNVLEDNGVTDTDYVWVQNYDSPFLFYPLTQPHGKSVAGIMTVSKYNITDCIRRSLPIETGFSKFFDLDRCYSKNYIDTDNGKQLVVYNVHLSAYTTNPETAENQVKMLNEDMLEEYNKGNYIIAGGDMNKDLLGDSSQYFGAGASGDMSWAQPFPTELLDEAFTLVAPFDEENPVPSCRNCDVTVDENPFVLTIDGFIISDNVEKVDAEVVDMNFRYADHNPVYMDFILK